MATNKEKLQFGTYSVELDAENLRFDEQTLGVYIQREGGFYDNYGYYLALAERNLQNKEIFYERIYCERFVEAKENGSDKLAEAKAKCDPDVVTAKESMVEARYIVNRLKNHLKSWDKNHDNAQSLGHMLRKQMDKLGTDTIYAPTGYMGTMHDIDRKINETVAEFDASSGFATDLGIDGLV